MADLQAIYRGMPLELHERDVDNRDYFEHCSRGDFRLQRCCSCRLLRYPPGPACPWCAAAESSWEPVQGIGAVYSYMEVHQSSQPAFQDAVPFLIILVELQVQRGQPTPDEGLRMVGNLVYPDGRLARADNPQFGIGAAVQMVFQPVAPGIALPQWVLCDMPAQPGPIWRYPG